MSVDVFLWLVGCAVVGIMAIAFVVGSAIWLWANFIHERFSLIFFRESRRRLSLASWHETVLCRTDGTVDEDHWPADDHIIGPHPFYLSYRIGKRRIFMMAGTVQDRRHNSIKGQKP